VVVLGCVHTYVRRTPSSARNLAGGIRAEATGQPRTAAADVGAPSEAPGTLPLVGLYAFGPSGTDTRRHAIVVVVLLRDGRG
jgi:hypothetical protein